MADSLPIMDETEMVFGIVVFEEKGGRKKIFFRQRDSTVIDLSDMNKFTAYLRRAEIPEEEVAKGIRFFNKHMLSF